MICVYARHIVKEGICWNMPKKLCCMVTFLVIHPVFFTYRIVLASIKIIKNNKFYFDIPYTLLLCARCFGKASRDLMWVQLSFTFCVEDSKMWYITTSKTTRTPTTLTNWSTTSSITKPVSKMLQLRLVLLDLHLLV